MMRYFTSLIISLAILCSCSKSDDLDELFIGRTLYVTSGLINSQPIKGDDLKKICQSDQTYIIHFNENTFSCTLDYGCTFSGTWTADGKNQTISLHVNEHPQMKSPLDSNIFMVLRNVRSYSGDSNIIKLEADRDNCVSFSAQRTADSPLK